ncbi:hypothetical protein [uncultured Nostoc sp.]|uniref:hypothetical protein n=1 Tax=uncultured Nostoc sp. TaxID=340711 RepID=UPI0035CA9E8F
MESTNTVYKSLRLNKTTKEYLINKSKELRVSQGCLITYAFSKLTTQDYEELKHARELVSA